MLRLKKGIARVHQRGRSRVRGRERKREAGPENLSYSHYKPIWCNGLPHGAGVTRPLLMTLLHQILKLPKSSTDISSTLSLPLSPSLSYTPSSCYPSRSTLIASPPLLHISILLDERERER